jgi:hypothetical protein
MTTTNQATSTAAPVLTPKFGTIDTWLTLSGMGRRTTYDELGRGNLRAVKVGTRTLINIEAGLAWLHSQPAARIRAPKQRIAA